MMRAVTEFDLRAEEFRHPDTKPEDLEFREDGKIVRKDRYERAFRSLVEPAGYSLRGFEIDEVVDKIQDLLKEGEIIEAILSGEPVVFRRIPQEDDEMLRGQSWTLLTLEHQRAGVTPYSQHFEWMKAVDAQELGYRVLPPDEPVPPTVSDERLQKIIEQADIDCRIIPKPTASPTFAQLRRLADMIIGDVTGYPKTFVKRVRKQS
jgi:hypothetical protein